MKNSSALVLLFISRTVISYTITTTVAIVLTFSPQNSIPETFDVKPTTDLTIAITNSYGAPLSLAFASNSGPPPIGDPQPTTFVIASATQYTFPTGWGGNIKIGPEILDGNSLIESSYTNKPDIDVSYVIGYSVPITCASEGVTVTGCNIELFQQPGISCPIPNGSVCLNPARNSVAGPAPHFFAACAHAAYTYAGDDVANVYGLESTLISCCIGTSCPAPARQPQSNYGIAPKVGDSPFSIRY